MRSSSPSRSCVVALAVGLLLVAADSQTNASPSSGVVVRIRLQSTAATPQSEIPVTFGQVFAVGDVPAGQRLSAVVAETGQRLMIQVDGKARHPDGSLRHAVVSAVLPDLQPGEVRTLELERGAATPAAPPLTVAGLLATGYDSRVSVTLAGRRYQASASRGLEAAPPAIWLSGPVATEWLVAAPLIDDSGRGHPHLTARFHVRAYAGYRRVLTDVSVENVWTYEPAPRNFRYEVEIAVNGEVRYHRADLLHLHHARWRRLFWTGGEPALHVAHDPRYLMASGAVPRYDPALIDNISPAHLQSYREFWRHEEASYRRDGHRFSYDKIGPMGLGLATQQMPDTGAHDDIGPLPRWAAVYLLSQDATARVVTLGMGDLGGSWSIHYRDRKTGLPVSLDDHPYVSSTDSRADTRNPATGAYEQAAPCAARPADACASPYVDDTAHQPSFAYLPYVISGDYYYLEELQFWATYNFVTQTPGYRELARGLFYQGQQERAQAWSLRTLGQVAYITPDRHPLKAYFNDKLQQNIAFFHRLYVLGQPNRFGALRPSYSYPAASPWMDDFWTWTAGYLVQLGFDAARPLAQWKARFPVQRMGFGSDRADDYCWIFAAPYHLLIAPDENAPMFQTIREAYRHTVARGAAGHDGFDDRGLPCASPAQAAALGLQVGEMDGYATSPAGYPAQLQPALAAAVDLGLPGAPEAWARFEARSAKPDYRVYPVWAIVPRAAQRGAAGPGGAPTGRP